MSSSVPPIEQMDRYGIRLPARSQEEPSMMATNSVLPGFFEHFGIGILAGRTFLPLAQPDELRGEMLGEVVLSASAARQFGWSDPASALGNTIEFQQSPRKRVPLQVVGVVKDVNMATVKQGPQPLVYVVQPFSYRFFELQLEGGAARTLEQVRAVWRKFLPREAFDTQFIEDRVESAYQLDRKRTALVGLFAALGVSVSLLGVMALALFQATRRAKEVAIRKVLGAPSSRLLALLAMSSLRQVFIAGAIAVPLIYYIMQQWLSAFVYRVQVSALFYLGVVALTAMIASIMIFAVTLRVVRRPPLLSLRTE